MLIVLVAWVDGVMIVCPPELVKKTQGELEKISTCKCEGPLTKYIGRKITMECDCDGLGKVKFMQPVLVHKLIEEYKPTDRPA